jgi:hypothetical protein
MATKKNTKVNEVSNDFSNDVLAGDGMKVIFADVKIRGMSMNKKDNGLTSEVNTDNNAQAGTANVTLKKYPDSFSSPIVKAGAMVYQVYKTHGLFMVDRYAIPVASFPKFDAELKEAKSKFNLAVSALRDAVQTGVLSDMAKAQQGDLYKPENDPTVEEIDRIFGIEDKTWLNLKCKGIKEAMAILGDEMVARLEQEHAKVVADVKKMSEQAGAKRIIEEVQTVVKDIQKNCQKKDIKGVQWKTLIKNIQDAINTLPNFNVTDNQMIKDGLTEMTEKFGKVKEYELKNDEAKRVELSTAASEIASRFANMF